MAMLRYHNKVESPKAANLLPDEMGLLSVKAADLAYLLPLIPVAIATGEEAQREAEAAGFPDAKVLITIAPSGITAVANGAKEIRTDAAQG